jgi:hypothetical protein
VVLGALEGDEF